MWNYYAAPGILFRRSRVSADESRNIWGCRRSRPTAACKTAIGLYNPVAESRPHRLSSKKTGTPAQPIRISHRFDGGGGE